MYEGLKASPVTDVHVFGRRGPANVKFTPLELRELGELRDVDMVVYDEDFDYDKFVSEEFGSGAPRSKTQWMWLVVAAVLLFAFILMMVAAW